MMNSSATNPLAFATWILVSPVPTCWEPVIVVEFAISNCPPTAFTLSFSKTVVLKVPRITASSTSNFPLSADDNLSPFTPGAKSLVFISVEFILNPPISPSIAFIPNLFD